MTWPTDRPGYPRDAERDDEEWRSVVGYEGLYEISNHGRVRTMGGGKARTHGRILRQTAGTTGYFRVALSAGNSSKTRKVHQLVAEAFIGPRAPRAYVLHTDGDPTNNHVANLRYGDARDNLLDAMKHGTWVPRRGEAASKAKLTTDEVRKIRASAEPVGVLAARYAVNPTSIRNIRLRRSWAHV